MINYECDESGNTFNKNAPCTPPQQIVTRQGDLERSKYEENLSQGSAHLVHHKIQTGDKFCIYNGCSNAFYQEFDLTIHQRTQTEEKFYHCGKYEECLY